MESAKSSPFALHKVDEISKKIQSDFDGDVPLRLKRLSKDPRSTLDAKRGLNFCGPCSSSHQQELKGKVAVSVVHAIAVASPGLSPTPFGVTNPSGILAHGFVQPRPQS